MMDKKIPLEQRLEKSSEQLTYGCIAALLVWLFVKHRVVLYLLILAVLALYLHRPIIDMIKSFMN